LEQD
jgi:hypothetical protein